MATFDRGVEIEEVIRDLEALCGSAGAALKKLRRLSRQLAPSPITAPVPQWTPSTASVTEAYSLTDHSPELLRHSDLMRILQLSRAQVYIMLASGEIPSVRIGRLHRVRRSDLNGWLASRGNGQATGTPEAKLGGAG